MKLRSMELTKKESGGGIECAPSTKDGGPRYPYGLEISLDETVLAKLGIELPEVGSYVRIRADACVTSVSSNQHKDNKPNRNVRVQIERLAVDPSEDESMEEALERGIKQA
jgi:hypothetical protein